jgi:hypothetical protein
MISHGKNCSLAMTLFVLRRNASFEELQINNRRAEEKGII